MIPRLRIAAAFHWALGTALALGPTAAICAAPLKVLPLGDSITAGDSDGDYRTRLWQRFGSDAAKLDLLGSLFGGPAALGDKSHEGHIGYSIAADPLITFGNITDNITRWVPVGRAQVVPDVILLMIGTNDVNYDAAQAPTAPDRLSHLISLISDPLAGRAPQAKLIVSSILPIDDSKSLFRATPGDFSRNARVTAFNAALPAMIAGHRANGENVFYFDMNARFALSDIKDGLHPTPAGYNKLGDAWYDAIQGVLVPEPATMGSLMALLALGAHAVRRTSTARRRKVIASVAASIALLCAPPAARCAEPSLVVTPFHANCVYEVGENVGWTVSLAPGAKAPETPAAYLVKRNNLAPLQGGQVDLSSGEATVQLALDEPAMLYLEVTPPAQDKEKSAPIVAGAAVAPTKLAPVAERPKDFDAFWKAKIEALAKIPPNAALNPGDSGRDDVEYATIAMDNIDGTHIYGQIAKPKKEGKYPALLILQWASPPYPLDKAWVVDRAAEGWLALNVEPHDVLPTEPQSYYDALPDKIKHYESIGNDDRDKSYFLRMYLGDYRAVDYLASRPDWDGKTLVCMGISMGGQQSLCVAGLHPKVTHVLVNVPAGCDTNGPLHGRQASYPNFPSDNPKVMETALYFDAVNFAPAIKAQCLVAMGFVDTVSAPAGIWTAFNLIAGPKEAAPMVDSPHNHLATAEQQRPWTERSEAWLAALVKGEPIPPPAAKPASVRAQTVSTAAAGGPLAANQPIERTDPNSRLAHQQMIDKAKKGGIDVYFLGDSITRRWGTSDAAYKPMLENWQKNFFGWNAGDFGWGGDTTQNILWRIENGELDGVNPKVIVILAGTNNVGAQAADDAKIADVAGGVEAIVKSCREKAPNATIILTAIFPRNDNMAAMPGINRINERLSALAEGKTIRFLNVNDKLADADGKLLPGMMGDGLHPTVAGYQVWADGLKPMLTELLGPPAATDHAPPPTGDPSAK